jgi:hypothetical protein
MRIPMLLTILALGCSDKDSDDTGGNACTETAWFLDADGDGHGGADRVDACDAPSGYVAQSTDCDDADATSNPDAEELCDDVDHNCDGDARSGATDVVALFGDADGDGFGVGDAQDVCPDESGWVDNDDDCNDDSADAFPGADELCDGIDNDCDGSTDGVSWPTDFGSDTLGDAIAATDSELLCIEAGEYADVLLMVDKTGITVRGAGVGETLLTGDGERAMWVENSKDSVVGDLTLRDGTIATSENITLDGVEFSGLNTTQTKGCEGCSLRVEYSQGIVFQDVDIVDNTLDHSGYNPRHLGMLNSYSSDIAWTGGRIADNTINQTWKTGTAAGVVVYGYDSTLDIQGVDVVDNAYTQLGEATAGTVQIASEGYFYLNASTFNLTDVDLVGNSFDVASANSGGVGYASAYFAWQTTNNSTLNWQGGSVSDNTLSVFATTQALSGLAQSSESEVVLVDLDISGNTVTCEAGTGAAAMSGLYFNLGSHSSTRLRIVDNHFVSSGVNGWMYGVYGGYDSDGMVIDNLVMAGNSVTTDNQSIYGLLTMQRHDITATNLSVVGNELSGYAVGGVFHLDKGSLVLENSVVQGNSVNADTQARIGAAVVGWDGSGEVVLNYNAFSDNSSNQAEAFMQGSHSSWDPIGVDGNIDSDAGFTDVSGDADGWDLTLGAGSALIDAGDPDVSDPDGSVCDIGAYGGPESM